MNSIDEIQSAIAVLSLEEMEALRDFLDGQIEDRLELSENFKRKIERGLDEIHRGDSRIRQPEAR